MNKGLRKTNLGFGWDFSVRMALESRGLGLPRALLEPFPELVAVSGAALA